MRTVVASFYMDNIPAEVARTQAAVLAKFVPSEVMVAQTLTALSHAGAMDDFIAADTHDIVIFLDIDCVPLNAVAIPALVAQAAEGSLAGCIQRANHIDNGGHLYVGPFCMALTRRLWEDLGRPSFEPTDRGDAGEELTYRCEALGRPMHRMWPSAIETPLWDLGEGRRFGLNTEYEGAFLHAFCIRDPHNQQRFVERCRDILG